jgi:hypothetical protein
VRADYQSNFTIRKGGASEHTEYWIPAEELPVFNENIVGLIEVMQEFGGSLFGVARWFGVAHHAA